MKNIEKLIKHKIKQTTKLLKHLSSQEEFNPCYICPKCGEQEFWIQDYGHFGCVAIDLNGNPIKEEMPKYHFWFEGRCFFCGHLEVYEDKSPKIIDGKPIKEVFYG